MEVKTEKKPGDITLLNMQKIIDFVRDYVQANGYSPTLEQIAVGIGKHEADAGNIHRLIKRLLAEGFLERSAGYRTLRVPKKLPRKYYYRREEEAG